MVVAATQAIVGDAAIVWIGHPRKASEFGSGDIIDDMRGSGAFNAAVDIIARLTKTKFTVKGRTDRGEDEPAKVQRDEDGFWELAERKGERQERTKTILESMPPGFTREDVLKRVQGELEIERATAQKLLKEIGFSIRKMKKSKGDV